MDAFARPIVPPAPKVHAGDLSTPRMIYEFLGIRANTSIAYSAPCEISRVTGLAMLSPQSEIRCDVYDPALTSANKSGCRSSTLSSLTSANGGFVFPVS